MFLIELKNALDLSATKSIITAAITANFMDIKLTAQDHPISRIPL